MVERRSNTERNCNLWFHPRKFIANNIKYRMASGRAIASYKSAQVFLMNEVAFNPFHSFSTVAKEILLLKYDVWFDFLCEVEQYLLVEDGKYVTESNIETIKLLSDERVQYYEYVMAENPGIFDDKYLVIWKEVHKLVYNFLTEQLNDLVGLNKSEGFKKLTNDLINIMNHTLYELYEVDILMFSDAEFVFNYDSLCVTYCATHEVPLIIKKLEIFNKIRKVNSIIIKGYDDAQIPFENSALKTTLEQKEISYKIL